jgi:hypothetical protein
VQHFKNFWNSPLAAPLGLADALWSQHRHQPDLNSATDRDKKLTFHYAQLKTGLLLRSTPQLPLPPPAAAGTFNSTISQLDDKQC